MFAAASPGSADVNARFWLFVQTEPWVTNPSTAQHGVCHEGVLYQLSNSGVVHYSSDLTLKAVVDPKLELHPPGVERVAVYR